MNQNWLITQPMFDRTQKIFNPEVRPILLQGKLEQLVLALPEAGLVTFLATHEVVIHHALAHIVIDRQRMAAESWLELAINFADQATQIEIDNALETEIVEIAQHAGAALYPDQIDLAFGPATPDQLTVKRDKLLIGKTTLLQPCAPALQMQRRGVVKKLQGVFQRVRELQRDRPRGFLIQT